MYNKKMSICYTLYNGWLALKWCLHLQIFCVKMHVTAAVDFIALATLANARQIGLLPFVLC